MKIFFRKIQFFISKNIISNNWDSGDILVNVFIFLIILTLSYNVYNAYQKGSKNKDLIRQEEIKLQELEKENQQLTDQVNYYNSPEYRRIYARENQNYAQPGEKLYYVIRPKDYEVDYYEVNLDPITLKDNVKWWGKLILGT